MFSVRGWRCPRGQWWRKALYQHPEDAWLMHPYPYSQPEQHWGLPGWAAIRPERILRSEHRHKMKGLYIPFWRKLSLHAFSAPGAHERFLFPRLFVYSAIGIGAEFELQTMTYFQLLPQPRCGPFLESIWPTEYWCFPLALAELNGMSRSSTV